jgi:hypothetical protein
MKIFLSNAFLRPSCTACPFTKFPRQADITIGDFWGYHRLDSKLKLNDGKGLSAVITNNAKGRELLKSLESRLKKTQEVPLELALKGNRNLVRSARPPQSCRSTFFEMLNSSLHISKIADYCAQKWCDCIIQNFWCLDNYGANLTAWALQETLKSFGLTARHVACYNNNPSPGGRADVFAKKYLDILDNCQSYSEVYALNEVADVFITGSDQVWRYPGPRDFNNAHFLDFTDSNKTRIACAVSFGADRLEGDFEVQADMAKMIRRFDHISVREDKGVEICQSNFAVEASHVQDPVFALEASAYDKIVKNSPRKEQNFIATYFLSYNEAAQEAELFLEKHFKRQCISAQCKYSNEDWLYLLKNCDFLLTDSFHGAAFAILFNKQFFAVSRPAVAADSRFYSLLSTYGLESRFLKNALDIKNPAIWAESIDYERVNAIINSEREKLRAWLRKATQSPKPAGGQNIAEIREARELKVRLLELEEFTEISRQKHSLFFNYCRYKLMAAVTGGKKKAQYSRKTRQHKAMLKRLKFLQKQITKRTSGLLANRLGGF